MKFNVRVDFTHGQQAVVVVKVDNVLKLFLTAKEASGLVKLLQSALTKTQDHNGDAISVKDQTRD